MARPLASLHCEMANSRQVCVGQMDGEGVRRFPGPAQGSGAMPEAARARSFQEFLFDHRAVLEPPVGFLFLARELRDLDTIIHICLLTEAQHETRG
jgi:hypothetical protein